MIDFLKDYYLQLKFFHILSVICWLAGILYLPRLFYYHTKSFNEDIGNTEIFETMEKKLISIIMNPSAIITIITGILLYCINIDVYNNFYWIYIKILCVLLILIFHIYLEKTRKKLFSGIFKHSQKYYAFINEIPTILMVIILYMAVVKPF